MREIKAKLANFCRRWHPYRWPVRLAIVFALILAALLPIWPDPFWLEASAHLTLLHSLWALLCAWPIVPSTDICLYGAMVLFIMLASGAAGTVLSVIGIAVYQIVRDSAVASALLPPDYTHDEPEIASGFLNYAPTRPRHLRPKWPRIVYFICVAVSLLTASFMKIWQAWYFGPGEGLGMRENLWIAISRLSDAHANLPSDMLFSLYLNFLINLGIASVLGLVAGALTAAAIRFRINQLRSE